MTYRELKILNAVTDTVRMKWQDYAYRKIDGSKEEFDNINLLLLLKNELSFEDNPESIENRNLASWDSEYKKIVRQREIQEEKIQKTIYRVYLHTGDCIDVDRCVRIRLKNDPTKDYILFDMIDPYSTEASYYIADISTGLVISKSSISKNICIDYANTMVVDFDCLVRISDKADYLKKNKMYPVN
jgi:hypothetical protein